MQVLSEREPDLCGLDHGEKGFMEGPAWDLEGESLPWTTFHHLPTPQSLLPTLSLSQQLILMHMVGTHLLNVGKTQR